ncbi:MAG: hypothetical protein VX278_08125 [Myxococcota bacterium]|nr:hypothetical protein [Myxococcota bacterium]
MRYFLLSLLAAACGTPPEKAEPTMQQGIRYAKSHPAQVAVDIDLDRNNLYFLTVLVPETETHKEALVHIHQKGYEQLNCGAYTGTVNKKKHRICFYKEKDQCGILHALTGKELSEAKYECKDPRVVFVNNVMHVNFGEDPAAWFKVENNKATNVADPVKPIEDANAAREKKKEDSCEKAKKNPITPKQAQKEFRATSWKGLIQLSSDLFTQVSCLEQTNNQGIIFAKIDEMLQPEFKKQTLKVNVDPSLKGAKDGSLSNCKMEYSGWTGLKFACKSSIDLSALEKSAGTDLEVVCEKPYKGESFVPYTSAAILAKNMVSVGGCFASGSKSVTVKAAK